MPHLKYLTQRRTRLDHSILAGYVGKNQQEIRLSEGERAVHAYLCGVSGSGKSRWLQSIMFQDIERAHPLLIIDPMGDLYRAVHEYVASCLEKANEDGFPVRDLADRYIFLDASDADNPVKVNPLEPQEGVSSEQLVDDLMKALERLLGGMEEQRKLRNVLRGAFLMAVELSALPPACRPQILQERYSFPLDIFFAADVLNMSDEERMHLMAALPDSVRLRFRRQYWKFFAQGGATAKHNIIQSSWNVFQYLLDDSLVLRVLNTHRSTLNVDECVRSGRSLICHLPIGGNLRGASFLGKFLTTKFQNAAYRRPEEEWKNRFYVYIDEFQNFMDQGLADALTGMRKFGMSFVLAHQSQSQPPFDTAEGQALLKTIKGNARMKAIFRLSRPDAEVVSQELFELTQKKENFQTVDRSVGRSEQTTKSTSRSTGQSTGSGTNSSRSNTSGSGQQQRIDGDSFDIDWGTTSNRSHGQNEGRSEHVGHSSSEQHSESTTEGTTESSTTRMVYYTLEGERELLVNHLQKLSDRECYLSTGVLHGELITTPYVPDELYSYQAENFPRMLLEWQKRRLRRALLETNDPARSENKNVLSFSATPVTFPAKAGKDDHEDAEEAVSAASFPVRKSPGNYPFVD